jgi:hypothetical protein
LQERSNWVFILMCCPHGKGCIYTCMCYLLSARPLVTLHRFIDRMAPIYTHTINTQINTHLYTHMNMELTAI